MSSKDAYQWRAERRRHQRFPTVIQAELITGGIPAKAEVSNLSNGGVLLKPERVVPVGAEVTVVIDWPGHGSLALLIEGKVVRSDNAGTAIKIRQYEWKVKSPQPVTMLLPQTFAQN